jgi:multidrug efflux system membrane fusion protein
MPVPSILRRAALGSLIALLATGCGKGQSPQAGGMPPPAVSVAEPVVKEITQWDDFTGRVEAAETVDIRPRVSGYVEKVHFIEGREVRKGDVLFTIDQRPYRAALNRAQAELARARAQAELSRSEGARARSLLDAHVISREEYEQRLAAESQGAAEVQAAEAALEVARLDLEFTEVRSPIDGRAGRAFVTAGNLVSTNPSPTVLTQVVSLDPIYVYFDGDEQTYLRYGDLARRGERPSSRDHRNPVLVGLADEEGFPHKGYVDFVDNQLNPQTGTIRARAVLDNKDRRFTPGLFARVKLLGSGGHEAVLVDDKAVLTDQDRKYVYVVGPENRAMRRDIRIGRSAEGLRVVTDGLAAGDRVIVHGVQKIFFPGMPVDPHPIHMGDPPSELASAAPAGH